MRHPSNPSSFNSLKFFDDNTGYIGGDCLFYTTDGGANWNYVNKPSGSIYAFYFKDFLNYYILNYYQSDPPKAYKTTDGGNSWVDLNLLNKYYFYEISGKSDTIYISGYLGELARSYNGGENWIYNDIINSELYSVYFLNQSTGWVCGAKGSLIYTTNGGDVWQKKYLPDSTVYLWNILFVNNNTGFIGANLGRIFRTTNSGNSWETYTTNTNSGFSYLSFINSQTGFASTLLGEIYKTTNSGVNWNLVCNFNGTFYNDICFFNENTGLIIKWMNGNNAILMTTDGGSLWNNVFIPDCALYDLYFTNSKTGFASGSSKIYKTNDGGYNWQMLTSFSSGFMNSITSKNNYVWSCGSYGKIMYSSNNGANWKFQNSKTNQTLSSIFFLDTNIGYVCGNSGFIGKTTNAGIVFISKISSEIPNKIYLEQNYPNPFNSSTNIKFHVSEKLYVQIKLYDILGKEIMTLINESKSPGSYEITFDASSLTSGIYFYRLTAGEYSETKKMIMIK